MSTAVDVVRDLQLAVFGGLAVVACARWRARRTEPTTWFASTLVVLGAVVVLSRVLPEPDLGSGAFDPETVGRKVLVGGLALFPYFLYRFAGSFGPPRRWVRRLAVASTAGLIAWAALLPSAPTAGVPRSTSFQAFLVAFVADWSVLSVAAAWRLWAAGRELPTVARRRMRLLALGALVLTVALVVAGAAPPDATEALDLAVGLVALASAPLFFLGYVPPAMLRRSWRGREEQSFRTASQGLVAATTTSEVCATVLPHVAAILAARGAAVADEAGRILSAHGIGPAEAAGALEAVRRVGGAGGDVRVGGPVLALRTGRHWLVVVTSPTTPLFGEEEVALCRALSVHLELALARAALFDAEQASRREAERLGEELESLVYSVSHDVKSPLISLSGYLDYLTRDCGDALPAEAHRHLGRIEANLGHMQALIDDLLTLSRIGRVETAVHDVDLGVVVADVVEGLRVGHPGVRFDVGSLSRVRINPARARELFGHLLENAVRHAGRDDVWVGMRLEPATAGRARVAVSDNGPGIPPADRVRVFGPFEQLAIGAGPKRGTGVGLTICRKIVEHAGGRIWVGDSEAGATFYVELPVAAESAPERGEPTAALSGRAT